MAVIEHLREDCGKYELQEIKACLKKIKQEEKKRRSEISQSFFTLKALSRRVSEIDLIFFKN